MSTKSIISALEQCMKSLGFSRRKAVWNRRTGSFIDVIDIQASKSGETVTVNVGVLHQEVHRMCWGTELPSIVEEPECTVRARVGQLIGENDFWWRLNDPLTGADIAEKLTMHILPFLDRMHSIEAMEQFLIDARALEQKYPPPIIYLALLKNERGDKAGACAILADLRTRTVKAWESRTREIMGRVGCT